MDGASINRSQFAAVYEVEVERLLSYPGSHHRRNSRKRLGPRIEVSKALGLSVAGQLESREKLP